jgi:hypothetical protein
MAVGDIQTLQGIFNPDNDYGRWLARAREDASQQLTRSGYYLSSTPQVPWLAKESANADGGLQRLRADYTTNTSRLAQNNATQLREQRYGYSTRGLTNSGGWRGMAGLLDRQYQQQKSDLDTSFRRGEGDYARQAQELTSRFNLADTEQQAQRDRARALLAAGMF